VAHLVEEEEASRTARERAHVLTRQANALREQAKWDAALPLCFEAHRADPTSPVAAHNLGVMLTKMGRLVEGEAILRKALALAPDSALGRHALAHNLLAQGRYRDAWPLYDARVEMAELKIGFPSDFAFPRWRGEPLAGKRLVIFPEQGLGDQIQFARFLPRLIDEAGEVVLLALPPLERLFRHNFPDAQVICATGKVEFPDPDVWTTMQDIPAATDLALEDVSDAPYLKPPGTWPALGDGFKIGLKAIGNPNYVNDAMRSLPPELAERLRRELPGRIISLEPGDSGAKDMADTAAIIEQVDMVVSVDTSVAHLAGAMGKACMLLVAGFGPDWRWMTDRKDSPWYSNHRLYRGDADGDWTAAVERLIEEARKVVRTLTARAEVNRAIELRDRQQIEEALAAAGRAAAIDPDDARAVHAYGVLLSSMGRLSESERLLRDSLSRNPDHVDSRYALSLTLLSQGRYRAAWPYHEARLLRPESDPTVPRNLPYPRWQGEDLRGKRIAIFPEQGFGDHIQFVRFVPELLRRGANVTLFAKAALVRLFANSFPDVDVLPTVGTAEFPDPDYWATLMDLPARLGIEIDTIPGLPYLSWPEVREGEGDRPRIGLKLSGNPKHRNDAWRTLSREWAERLSRQLPGTLVSLEPKDSGARDFADTAAIIAGLDLVISVDTSVAHLAGAMGKPCLLLVSGYDTDWRWMRDRPDSPWYPRHSLFRSTIEGDWSTAIDDLVRAVEPALHRAAAERLMAKAQALRAEGRPIDALAAVEQAVATDPSSVNAAYMHGVFLTNFGRLAEAETVLRRVIEAAPDLPNPRDALATNLLAQGRSHEGWPLYEARTEREGLNDGFPRGFPYPRWRGESLKGKRIAVFPEQGLGDQIQYVRFVRDLLRLGAKVTLLTPPTLVRLFAQNFPDVDVVSASGTAEFADPDYWTTLVDLAVRLRVQPDLLGRQPYLRVPTQESKRADDVFRVGLVTRGSSTFSNDIYRSLPPELGERLRSALPGDVVDLSPEATRARDFAETAAIIAELDLVVSVDTAVAHLAGAMGKVCMLMLPGFATDWRWMRERNDTPWYPEHLLCRAEIDTGWPPVIERVILQARQLARPAARFLRQAMMLRDQHQYGEALVAGRKALAAEPQNLTAMHNLARLLADFGRSAEAEKLQRRALKMSGEDIYRYGLGLNLLGQGRYQEGWPLYESRTRLSALRAGFPQGVKFPRWMGDNISGKRIAIFPEQGLGDQMQFARFLPRLRERCSEIVLLAPPPLLRLFEQAFPDLTIVKAAGPAQFPRSDAWTTLVELGRLLDVRLETLPSPEYLYIKRSQSGKRGFRIGFMAKGNPGYVHDFHRTLPQEDAGRLRAALPGEIVDLDPAVSGAKDFLDTAHIMADLDLIVSVDTSVGHLAGVMGKPCCLLIPGFGTDWRWLHDRSDSPWYPKHRLFRGGADGDWGEAVAMLIAHVGELAEQAAALP